MASSSTHADSSASPRASRLGLFCLAILIAGYGVALTRSAWLADDAYISFRSVDHLLAGRGPVWNAGERVQAFTHPLWFLLIAGVRAVSGEFYYSVLGLSMALSLVSVVGAVLAARTPWPRRALMLALCCTSRAFVDYSTSGLENPLSHGLLVLFMATWLRAPGSATDVTRYFRLVLLASLGVLTRQDALLLYAPALALEATWTLFGRRPAGGAPLEPVPMGRPPLAALLRATIFGLSPFLLWEAFSIVYYGFPFPNTAYAKLSTGVARSDLLVQGLQYLNFTLEHDLPTHAVILAGLVAGIAERDPRIRALALGIGLYLAYVVRIGGDFMGGRFLALPFWAAVLLLMNAPLASVAKPLRRAAAGLLLAVSVAWTCYLGPVAPLLSGPGYPYQPLEGRAAWDWRGISNERGGYYPWTGLLREKRDLRSPAAQPWARLGRQFYSEGTPIAVLPAVGFVGHQAAERTMIVDPNALTDPLLARLPAMQQPRWRIGHFTRMLPPGYLQTLMLGENRITDPAIAAFYQDIQTVTRGPIWSRPRIRAIARVNLHKRPVIADPDFYRAPPGYAAPARRHYPADWFDAGSQSRVLPGTDSFAIYWREATSSPAIEIAPPPVSAYDIEVARGGVELGRFLYDPAASSVVIPGGESGASVLVRLPVAISGEPFDTLRFFPRGYADTQTIATIRRYSGPASPPSQTGPEEEIVP